VQRFTVECHGLVRGDPVRATAQPDHRTRSPARVQSLRPCSEGLDPRRTAPLPAEGRPRGRGLDPPGRGPDTVRRAVVPSVKSDSRTLIPFGNGFVN